MRNFYIAFFFIFSTFSLSAQSIATFESFNLPLDTFLNGSDGQTVFQDSDINFPTNFSGGFWIGGWAISTKRDDTTSTFENLYSAKIASGFESSTYAVGQQNAVIRLDGDNLGKVVDGLYLTNSTFAHDVIRDGNTFSKKFGGETGNDPDFFRLDIQKYYQGELSTEVVEFYLADYRFEDNSEDFIVDDWQWVDLTSLGNVDSLQFTLSSSDIGDYGINTPLFFAIDNLELTNAISTSNENIALSKQQIKFYPNPAINEIIIDFEVTDIEGTIQIFDMLGRSIVEQPFDTQQPKIDVSQLGFGAYILQIVSREGKRFSSTFVKK